MLLSTPTKTSQDSGCGPGGTCSSGEERVKTNPGKRIQKDKNKISKGHKRDGNKRSANQDFKSRKKYLR